jgi:hypothetical protein
MNLYCYDGVLRVELQDSLLRQLYLTAKVMSLDDRLHVA